ncbi:MAG: four-carbon acid sugar kinase family protein [Candidatus Sulfotelmatobacter sp.]
MTDEPANVECILIADDLTGACDTGVQFVRCGLSCRVELNLANRHAPAMTDVLAFTTNSRSDSAVQCRDKIEELAVGCSQLRPNIIFKKVDSTLRGNVGEEITAALRAFQCEAAIIAPAFPAMRRVVRDGTLHWVDDSGSGQIHIAGVLAQQGIPREKLVSISSSNRDLVSELNAHVLHGKQFFIMDCESQHHLHFAVAVGTATSRRILWVGSAGLGIALADRMARSGPRRSVSALTDVPMLFVTGSTHPASVRQKETLLRATAAVEVVPAAEAVAVARRALRDRRHLVVTIEPGRFGEFSLRQFFDSLSGLRVAALFLTGGDTGALVCNAIGARSIDLRDEIEPGFPWGILNGGMFHGLPVASKGGGFGGADALLCCADFFASAQRTST